jgi:dimethylhistidine N-methyltransferase
MRALARSTARATPSNEVLSPFASDVLAGLSAMPKRLPAKYFYDAVGSLLFEAITKLPEYYPTRTELSILQENAPAMVEMMPAGVALVEFGSGPATKAQVVLQAAGAKVSAYAPVDISAEFLHQEAERLRQAAPNVAIVPVAADFTQPFALPEEIAARPRVGFFPGSTIGNFEPHEASTFLRNAARILGPGALFFIGVDLVKDVNVLHRAYNDAAGVTAAFNLNLLGRINRELGADIPLQNFEHHAFYNRELRRVEMHLASLKRQKVHLLGRTIDFRAGETIHTENSYKYTPEGFGALARGAGWRPRRVWVDPNRYFSVHALVSDPTAIDR